MKFLIVVRSLKLGGMERVAVNLSDTLAEMGHTCHLLYFKHSKEQILPKHKSVSLHFFNYNKRLHFTGIGLMLDLISRLVLNPVIRKSHFLWVGMLGGKIFEHYLARLEKKYGKFDSIIFRGQGTLELVWNWHDPRLKFVVENIIADKGTGIKQKIFSRIVFHRRNLIAVSNGVADSLNAAQQRLKWKANAISVITNPCPVQDIRTQANVIDPEIPSEPYIINVARLVPQKDHALLLEAYQKCEVPEKLVIVGSGRLKNELVQLANDLHIADKVIFAGARQNPYPWIKRAKCLVLSSKFEGLGVVLLESLALDTPVLSVDCPGGVRDILKEDLEKYLVERNSAALSEGIRKVLSEPAIEINPNWLNDFKPEKIANKYCRVANGLLIH